MPLTVVQIKNAKPGPTRRKLSDGRRLILEISPKGVKTWKMQYEFDRKQRTITLGRWPDFSLAEARDWREKIKATLRRGEDPQQGKKGRTQGPSGDGNSFEEVGREFLEKQRGIWDQRYHAWVVRRFEHDIFPEVGAMPLSEFSHDDVLRLIKRFEARDAIETGRKTLRYVSKVLQYGIATKRATNNPVPETMPAMKPRPRVKHYARLPKAELPEFYRRLSECSADKVTTLAIRWTVLTMVRTNETRFMKPDEIEQRGGKGLLWRIPAERMKMSREHVVPLPPQAEALLEELDTIRLASGSPWMFPQSRNPEKPISENRMLYCLYDLGYKGIATMHGFRGLASTVLNEQVAKNGGGMFDRDWIELQLAHDETDEVRAAYNAAEYLGSRRRMLQWWARFLEDQEVIGALL